MIKIDANFSIERDKYQWILTEKRTKILETGKRKGEIGDVLRDTYHANLEQVAKAIIGRCEADMTTLTDLHELYLNAVKLLYKHIEIKAIGTPQEDIKAPKKRKKRTSI